MTTAPVTGSRLSKVTVWKEPRRMTPPETTLEEELPRGPLAR